MKREQSFSIKGMTRDISRSKSGANYAYEIKKEKRRELYPDIKSIEKDFIRKQKEDIQK